MSGDVRRPGLTEGLDKTRFGGRRVVGEILTVGLLLVGIWFVSPARVHEFVDWLGLSDVLLRIGGEQTESPQRVRTATRRKLERLK